MRKNFLILMLLSLLPLAGWAQFSVGNFVPKGNFIYEITQAADASTPGKVVLYGIRDGYNPVDAGKALNLEGKVTIAIVDGPSFDFIVDYANEEAVRKTYTWTSYTAAPTEVGAFAGMTEAESVVIPKEFLTIKQNTFYGYTNMETISFEANSEVTTIESGAFNTTRITAFDFSNCSKLTSLSNGVFVQDGAATNSFIETITLPENSEALTDIGTAFQRLTSLTAINNLDKSLITTVVEDAFKGDTNLEELALPATVQTIEANAFRGSGIETLTIDVTSLNDNTAGNVYGSADLTTLRYLTLKGTLTGEFKSQAFKGCTKLTTLDMTGLTINGGKIGDSAFEGCTKLETLTFNDITEGTIGNAAFNGCTKLESVTFGKITGTELKDALIDQNAFSGCTKLGELTFGDLEHVTIDQNAFKNLASGTLASSSAAKLQFAKLTDVDINASAFEGGAKLKTIQFGAADGLNIASKAFAGCATNASATLTFSTLKDVVIAGTATTTGAFYNTTKLHTIEFGTSENLTIQDFAFENSASAQADATLEFKAAKNLVIGASAFKGAEKLKTITFGDIEDVTGSNTEIAANAFEGTSKLESLTFGNLKNVQIKGDAFLNATTGVSGYASVTFANLEGGSAIEDDAFKGATKLNSVTIADITDSKIGSAGVQPVFPAVKTVNIGAVKSTTDATLIAATAFKFANQSGATLSLANGKSLTTVASATNALIDADAFDFQATTGAGISPFVAPVITIGEIKTAKTMATGALKGDKIAQINFNGNIAAGALDVMIVTGNTDVDGLTTLTKLVFNGEIAAAGIAAYAFASLPAVMDIIFNGKLAAGAIPAGAFEGLKDGSQVTYAYNGADLDLNVNPFAKGAFKFAATLGETRIIKFSVTNESLKAKYQSETAGLETDGTFGIYLAYFYVAPVVVPDDFSFLVYPDNETSTTHTTTSPRTAWARWELGHRVAEGVTGTLTAGQDLVIKRVQKIDGTHDAKITIYGTYTDEDDALNQATVYMIPLKVNNGHYYIPGTNTTTLIVRVDNNGADFTEKSYKVAVETSGYAAEKNSIWTGLVNDELYVASNIMTHQQLIDGLAVDVANADASGVTGYFHAVNNIDIYRGGDEIAEDLYRMSDPSKNIGFRIEKTEITKENKAYINTGVYYMLLKHYEGQPAAARVVWMDDASDNEITGILTVKNEEKNVVNNNAIYTLQGVRVDQMKKGQIYIMNGKKYIAK